MTGFYLSTAWFVFQDFISFDPFVASSKRVALRFEVSYIIHLSVCWEVALQVCVIRVSCPSLPFLHYSCRWLILCVRCYLHLFVCLLHPEEHVASQVLHRYYYLWEDFLFYQENTYQTYFIHEHACTLYICPYISVCLLWVDPL